MAKLTITLKQHTPLIHFQSEQEGATIRATEFKPKLDKFLEKYASNEIKKIKENGNFNYKVKFFNVKNLKVSEIGKYFPFYFNNIGRDSNDKNKFIFCDSIDVEFFSLNKEILEIIERWIEKFLLVNNFGFRQNKGFGSFTILGRGSNDINLIKELKINTEEKFFYIDYKRNTYYRSILDDAGIIYQLIKSGINYPRDEKSYHRSYLFNYMKDRNIGNEKRFIKEEFFEISKDNMPKKYVRALLGVADGVKFKDGEIKYKSDIERFQSPILFKITNNKLFIIPQKINEEMYDTEFQFLRKGDNSDKTILTPTKDEFALVEFLEAFVDHFNNKLIVSNANNLLENKLRNAKLRKIEVVK